MSPIRRMSAHTFRSMHNRNYRLYFFGQLVSVSGSWMQMAAQVWLVLKLTHNNGTAIGFLFALQFLPMLIAGSWGGLIVDRNDKRKLLFMTQAGAGALGAILGVLTLTNHANLPAVFVLAFVLGCVNVFDNPARQTFVMEMVGADDVANAVSLNSVMFNAGRIVGPALAAVAIKAVGIGPCFLINAVSYLAIIAALLMMDTSALQRSAPTRRSAGQLRDGFRYVWSTPELRVPLLMMAVVGTLAFNFQVVAPLIVRKTFHGDVGTFGFVMSMSGVGAVIGGFATALLHRPTVRIAALIAVAMGVTELGAGLAPSIGWETLAMAFLGAAGIAYVVVTNSTLQLASDPAMRGRVMALFGIAFLGSTPIGGPMIGWAANHFGPRAGFLIGGVAALAAGFAALPTRTAAHRVRAAVSVEAPTVDEPASVAVA